MDLPAYVERVTLEPTKSGDAGVAPDTRFRLTSRDGTPVAELAARLTVTPAVALTSSAPEGNAVAVTPAKALTGGETYRFSLAATDGTTLASWAMPVATPPRIVGTIPSDRSTMVPVNTGIELSFDQRGITAADLQAHWRIAPAVDGRFEVQGRMAAFVPTSLAKNTLYTITVTKGLPLAGTGFATQADTVFRFETGERAAKIEPVLAFRRPLSDASTTEKAAIPLRTAEYDDELELEPLAATVDLVVHRLPNMAEAIAAWRVLRDAPDWTQVTGTTPVSTAGLPVTLTGEVPLRTFANWSAEEDDGNRWILVPQTLRAGWYLVTVTHRGIARQSVLQVTDLATWSMASVTQSAFWVNNVANGAAVSGAAVTLAGAAIGATDADGLLVAKTPAAALATGPDRDVVAEIRAGGRAAFLPVGAPYECAKCEAGAIDPRPDRWWTLVSTDRVRYRPTDTLTVWGVVRERDRDAVPASVEVRVVPWNGDGSAPPVAVGTATPNAAGAWVASLSFTDLPASEYMAEVRVGTAMIAEAWIMVGPITKPAYQVEVTASPRAVIAGTEVTVTARATFFEGTPVPGVELRFGYEDSGITATTDAMGVAVARMTPRRTEEEDGTVPQRDDIYVGARPTTPEEAEIVGQAWVTVFGADALLETQSSVTGTRLVTGGLVRDVDLSGFATMEPGDSRWDVDAAGDPRANATVRIRVIEEWTVATRTGTSYDFITKTTTPVYTYDYRERDLGMRTARTGADGKFSLAWTVTGGSDRWYRVIVTYTDPAGRMIGEQSEAFARTDAMDPSHGVWLNEVDPIPGGERQYSVGDPVRVELLGGRGGRTAADRYLFAVAQRGLRYAVVGEGARFITTFTERSVPGIAITGVRFNGRAYESSVNGYYAGFDEEDRRMTVSFETDRSAYVPGAEVALTVRTRDANGRGIPATIFVGVVDEKLYAIGAAMDTDPLHDLYRRVDSGVTAVSWSHRSAEPENDDGKGDTTGGGRDDFRDWLVARLVTTGSGGAATIRFTLSDDLTSWHATGSAVDEDLRGGVGSIRIPVRLPFFAEATLATEYLVRDDPVMRVRAYGSALKAGDPVTFQVSSESLGMAVVTVKGTAFEPVEVPLPRLTVGSHAIRVAASTGSGEAKRDDAVIRTIRVVETRAVRRQTTTGPLTAGMTVGSATGSGPTVITIVDAGRGRFVPLLGELAGGDTGRADRAFAAALAAAVLEDAFGLTPDAAPVPDEDLHRFQAESGISLVPYGSPDLRMSVLAALTGDTRLNARSLSEYFDEVFDDTDRTREDRILALAGKAALGEPVIGDVREAAAQTDLGAWERVALAAAAMALGDEPLARTLERAELAAHGQRLGPWVRLVVDGTEDDTLLTAWLFMTAAWLGDPLALDMDAWLVEHPPVYDLVDLERAIGAAGWAARTPGAETVIAWTVDGVRHEETIDAGGAFTLSVTPAQRATLHLDPVRGTAVVGASWDARAATVPLTPAPGMTFSRSVSPGTTVTSTELVVVTFSVELGEKPDRGCWQVTDYAPSGLVPLGMEGEWRAEESVRPGWFGPWRVTGQRVDFCVSPDPKQPVQTLRYVARVVTSGTYAWEPASLQSSVIVDRGATVPAATVTIRGLEG